MNSSIQNRAAYINGWLEALKKDSRFIVHASGQAQKAVDFIFNVSKAVAKDEIEPLEIVTEE